MRAVDIQTFEAKAAEATKMLKLLANEHRLLVLCRLVAEREMTVGDIAGTVGLSQSALSQHLAKMRDDGLVATRRDGQTIYYRLADKNVARVLTLLKNIFCP